MNEEKQTNSQKSAEALFRKLRLLSFFSFVLAFAFFGFGIGFGWNYILTFCLLIGFIVIGLILPFTIRRIKIKRDMELVKLMHLQTGSRGKF